MNGTPSGIGLAIERVTKRFGAVTAVDGISLDIKAGEFLTLLGPSGSGKTTLLMMIAGFQDISEGDIRVEGASISGVPPEKRNFGMVFQGYALFPHMTVAGNITYPLNIRRWDKEKAAARVGAMLDLVQLKGLEQRYPRELSGGQQQRVALARALSFSPKALLLDEPLGALDRKLRVDVQEQLKDIHRRVGTTFIYVTHDQEEALTMSDRVVIMDHGRIVQVGTPSELYEQPNSRFSASFLGKSNFISRDGRTYALRPEKIDVFPRGKGSGQNIVSGRISNVTYMGSLIKLSVATADANELEVHADAWRNRMNFTPGAEVRLSWSDEAAVLVEGSTELETGGRPAINKAGRKPESMQPRITRTKRRK
ncbi:MAG: ABC transporter ATP-binding protein [Aestuariivirga sp.]